MALFSITTLYNYDPTIFEGFRVPETLDRNTVISELCLQLAELSLVYPSPSTMKTAIKLWTDIHYKEWCDLEDTLYYEYNPIWNVDGVEVEERDLNSNHTKTGTDTVNASGKDSIQASGKDSVQASGTDSLANTGSDTVSNSGTDTNTRTGSVENIRSVVGYNSSSYAPAEKNTETYNSVDDAMVHGLETETEYGSTATTTYGRKDETTYGRKDETTYGRQDQTTYNTTDDIDDTGTITRTRQGNIGVTKTQDLIQSQREIVQFNVTDFIIRQFKRKFCVMVY